MSGCQGCGAPDQVGRFCTNCGRPVVAPPTEIVGPDQVRRGVGPGDPTVIGAALPDPATGAFSTAPPTGAYPLPAPTTPDVRTVRPRRGRGAVALVVLAVAVVLLAGVAVWFTMRPVAGEGAASAPPPTTATPSAVEGPDRVEEPGADPATRPAPVGPGGSKGDRGPSAPATTLTTVATTTVGLNPMGGDRSDIACGSGYIVQIASELDQPTFAGRVAELRAAGTLPADARWTETASGCSLFRKSGQRLRPVRGAIRDLGGGVSGPAGRPARRLHQTDRSELGQRLPDLPVPGRRRRTPCHHHRRSAGRLGRRTAAGARRRAGLQRRHHQCREREPGPLG